MRWHNVYKLNLRSRDLHENQMIQDVTACYRVLHGVTGCYRVLQDVTGC